MKNVLRKVAIGLAVVGASIGIATAASPAHADTAWPYAHHVALTIGDD
ncbi:MAG: hypothetical protein FWF28_10665 [Micrococcales bacterium]|nr:hypothetical protein [Micrococcales bacterium]MCL2543520.1 hypothetical protein [Nocardioidaceae bacterium]MCL2614084.1 hypothetical protein [Nocardioidaceae bacterium]